MSDESADFRSMSWWSAFEQNVKSSDGGNGAFQVFSKPVEKPDLVCFLRKNPSHISSFLQSCALDETNQDIILIIVDMPELHYLKHTKCAKVWEEPEIVYRCRTCASDPTSVLCMDCFRDGNHEGHDYSIIRPQGGCCDCGDVEAWDPAGFCPRHQIRDQRSSALPSHSRVVAEEAIKALLSSVHAYLQCIPTNSDQVILEEADKDHDGFYGESASFFSGLWREISPREGREPFIGVALEERNNSAATALDILHTFAGWSDDMVLMLVHEMCVKRDGEMSHLKYMLSRETRISSNVRVKLHKLYYALMTQVDFKKVFVREFLYQYPVYVKNLIKEVEHIGHQSTHETRRVSSVLKFSVQLFNRKALISTMQESGALPTVVTALLGLLHRAISWVDVKDGQLPLCERAVPLVVVSHDLIKTLAYMDVVSDLGYLLLHEEFSKDAVYGAFRAAQGGGSVFMGILRAISLTQYIVMHRRALRVHVLYDDSRDAVTAFSLEIDLVKTFMFLLKGFLEGPMGQEEIWKSWQPLVRTQVQHVFEEFVHALQLGFNDARAGLEVAEGKARDCLYRSETALLIPPFNVGKDSQPVTVHIPVLHAFARFSSAALGKWNVDFSQMFPAQLRDIQLLLKLLDTTLKTMVFLAQVEAGMWIRNGSAVLTTTRVYCDPLCHALMPDMDLFILQICACLLPPSHFLELVLHRFDIDRWILDPNSEMEEEDSSRILTVAETCLLQLVRVASDRTSCGWSMQEVARREVVHILAVQDSTHSQVSKRVCFRVLDSPHFEDELKTVGEYRAPMLTEQGLFRLRDSVWNEYDPFFLHYAQKDRQVADERYRAFAARQKQAASSPYGRVDEVLSRPTHTALKNIFSFLDTPVFAQMVFVVLLDALRGESRRTSDRLLSLCLHLLSLAVVSASPCDDAAGECADTIFEFAEWPKKGSLFSLLRSRFRTETEIPAVLLPSLHSATSRLRSCQPDDLASAKPVLSILLLLRTLESSSGYKQLQPVASDILGRIAKRDRHCHSELEGKQEEYATQPSNAEDVALRRKMLARQKQQEAMARLQAQQKAFARSQGLDADLSQPTSPVSPSITPHIAFYDIEAEEVCSLCHGLTPPENDPSGSEAVGVSGSTSETDVMAEAPPSIPATDGATDECASVDRAHPLCLVGLAARSNVIGHAARADCRRFIQIVKQEDHMATDEIGEDDVDDMDGSVQEEGVGTTFRLERRDSSWGEDVFAPIELYDSPCDSDYFVSFDDESSNGSYDGMFGRSGTRPDRSAAAGGDRATDAASEETGSSSENESSNGTPSEMAREGALWGHWGADGGGATSPSEGSMDSDWNGEVFFSENGLAEIGEGAFSPSPDETAEAAPEEGPATSTTTGIGQASIITSPPRSAAPHAAATSSATGEPRPQSDGHNSPAIAEVRRSPSPSASMPPEGAAHRVPLPAESSSVSQQRTRGGTASGSGDDDTGGLLLGIDAGVPSAVDWIGKTCGIYTPPDRPNNARKRSRRDPQRSRDRPTIAGGWWRKCGLNVRFCGHTVHLVCLRRYVDSLRTRRRFEGEQIINLDMMEFLCPQCRSLGNVLVPVTPATRITGKRIVDRGKRVEKSDPPNRRAALFLEHAYGVVLKQVVLPFPKQFALPGATHAHTDSSSPSVPPRTARQLFPSGSEAKHATSHAPIRRVRDGTSDAVRAMAARLGKVSACGHALPPEWPALVPVWSALYTTISGIELSSRDRGPDANSHSPSHTPSRGTIPACEARAMFSDRTRAHLRTLIMAARERAMEDSRLSSSRGDDDEYGAGAGFGSGSAGGASGGGADGSNSISGSGGGQAGTAPEEGEAKDEATDAGKSDVHAGQEGLGRRIVAAMLCELVLGSGKLQFVQTLFPALPFCDLFGVLVWLCLVWDEADLEEALLPMVRLLYAQHVWQIHSALAAEHVQVSGFGSRPKACAGTCSLQHVRSMAMPFVRRCATLVSALLPHRVPDPLVAMDGAMRRRSSGLASRAFYPSSSTSPPPLRLDDPGGNDDDDDGDGVDSWKGQERSVCHDSPFARASKEGRGSAATEGSHADPDEETDTLQGREWMALRKLLSLPTVTALLGILHSPEGQREIAPNIVAAARRSMHLGATLPPMRLAPLSLSLPPLGLPSALTLTPLPGLYEDLLRRADHELCKNCGRVPERPALCLLCGMLCCLAATCCQLSPTKARVKSSSVTLSSIGEGSSHAWHCGCGMGAFLLVRHTYPYILREERGAVSTSIYLDRYGEEDLIFRRGRPLFLHEARYTQLAQVIASHSLEHWPALLKSTRRHSYDL
eukprot:Rmarinus@m.10585